MNVLVINCGSSSIKYQVVDPKGGSPLVSGKVERVSELEGGHAAALKQVVDGVAGHTIDAVGHRVVHGGEKFHDSVAIDDDVIAAIEACVPLAPLHNPANLAGIREARKAWSDVPHVAVFDTAFHVRMPRRARTYAIEAETARRLGIRRFGFHGTSHGYVAQLAAGHLDTPLDELRLITCHLGNGASVCAVEHGQSVDTSMGLTPLEGLVMGTRSGDVDPGVVLTLARDLGIDEADELLNRRSGLAGLSGLGNDLRDIEDAAADGHDGARLAIAVFAHRLRKYIGAYAAVLGDLDAIIMTGGIGENSVTMRRRMLQRLGVFGIRLDEHANADAKTTDDVPVAEISAASSRVKVLVVKTNEERQIARATARVVDGLRVVKTPGPIPIAVSARHVHLDEATLERLFGEGHELTVYKEISQPGQFAAEERVTLHGPRGSIERVRVLGPLRKANQIEVSRTDEFKLGVDAPIRGSGKVKGSAPITVEGPAGKVELEEGLICARRHIHMTPEDAEAFGVEDQDVVEVALTGGPRDLTFGDVLVRVKSSYLLEMHIDTDEANAAELSRGAAGDLVYTAAVGGAEALLRSRR